jgi:ABC-type molybdate transport system ATPase subunit
MGKPMVSAQALRFGQPGLLLWDGASHGWPAGLCLVRGGEGSGKTSLLQVLAGQLPLQGGRLDRPPAAFWRDPRAELGQAERALPVQEWVQAQRQLHPAWSEAVWQLHANGLGLEPHLHKPLLALSTGSLRKLWMAAGWASGAPLLLIDEPLAALDAQRKAEVLPYLDQLHRELDSPVVYVSHSIDEVARLAQHLVLLDTGRIVAAGPTEQLLARLDLPLSAGDTAAWSWPRHGLPASRCNCACRRAM